LRVDVHSEYFVIGACPSVCHKTVLKMKNKIK